MFIQTEQTPNPMTLKFLPGREVSPAGARVFPDAESAGRSALARSLFAIDGVDGVMLGGDFVAVTRRDDAALSWPHLKAPILAAVMDHFTALDAGAPVDEDDGAAAAHGEEVYEGPAAEIVAEIKELLDTRVRPAVARDGGDILFDRFDALDGTVYLHMRGACSGCPSSSATLKAGVESMLRHYVPEVVRVEQTL